MNIEPCVRFGIRINPKISEKPADNRKSRPPNVMLLMASTAQILMSGVPAPRIAPHPSDPTIVDRTGGGGIERQSAINPSRFAGLYRRPVARVGRLLEVLCFVRRPELTYIVVSLLRDVGQLAAGLLDLADEHIADDVAELVEAYRPTRRFLEVDRPQRLHCPFRIRHVAVQRLEPRFDHHAV